MAYIGDKKILFSPKFHTIDGYPEGYEAGKVDGYNSGYAEGHTQGRADGFTEGETQGYESGKTEGIEQGRQAAYDDFWDMFQCNGERTQYNYAFAESGSVTTASNEAHWSKGGYTPKYKVQPNNAYGMFHYFGGNGNLSSTLVPDLDLKQFFIDNNWDIDLTKIAYSTYCFQWSPIINCPPIALGNCQYTFSNCARLKIIDKIIFNNSSATSTKVFGGCSNLEEIYEVEGEIKGNGLDFSPCPKISKETILRVFNVLATTTNSRTLTLGSTNLAKLTDEEKAIATNKGWTLA